MVVYTLTNRQVFVILLVYLYVITKESPLLLSKPRNESTVSKKKHVTSSKSLSLYFGELQDIRDGRVQPQHSLGLSRWFVHVNWIQNLAPTGHVQCTAHTKHAFRAAPCSSCERTDMRSSLDWSKTIEMGHTTLHFHLWMKEVMRSRLF
mgnify:CR=1 FL=1